MPDPKVPDPGRRSFLTNLFRSARKWTDETGDELVGALHDLNEALEEPLAQLAEVRRELDTTLHEAATAVSDALHPDPAPGTGVALAELQAQIAGVESSQADLMSAVQTLTTAAQVERADTVALSERLAESDALLTDVRALLTTIQTDREAKQQDIQEVAALQTRVATAQAWVLDLLKKIVIGATGAALYEAFVADEIYPWLKERVRAAFDQAVLAGELDTSPLPAPTPDALPTEAPHPKPARTSAKLIPDLVRVGAGWFWMGSDKRRDKKAREDELPQHRLYLPTYHIGRYPVTNQEYRIFVLATGHRVPSHWQDGKIPKLNVESSNLFARSLASGSHSGRTA